MIKKPNKNGIYISLMVPKTLHAALLEEAKYEGRSLAQMIRRMLTEACFGETK